MQNFGKIKNVFNNLLVEGIVKKDDEARKLFKQYIKAIKESKILKTQFLVYNNIENRIDEDMMSANIFISENIKLLEKYSKDDIQKENQKLTTLLDKFKDKLDESYELSNLHESLSSLIFTQRTPKTIDKITTEIKNVTKFISSNKPKEVKESFDLPVSVLTKIMVEKYNEKYSTLDESDRKTLKSLISSNLEEKKVLYSQELKECTELVDKLIKETNDESKDKLLKVKNKLSEDMQEITEDNFMVKFTRLIDLKNNLKN